jgi:hypothetical protein
LVAFFFIYDYVGDYLLSPNIESLWR